MTPRFFGDFVVAAKNYIQLCQNVSNLKPTTTPKPPENQSAQETWLQLVRMGKEIEDPPGGIPNGIWNSLGHLDDDFWRMHFVIFIYIFIEYIYIYI